MITNDESGERLHKPYPKTLFSNITNSVKNIEGVLTNTFSIVILSMLLAIFSKNRYTVNLSSKHFLIWLW